MSKCGECGVIGFRPDPFGLRPPGCSSRSTDCSTCGAYKERWPATALKKGGGHSRAYAKARGGGNDCGPPHRCGCGKTCVNMHSDICCECARGTFKAVPPCSRCADASFTTGLTETMGGAVAAEFMQMVKGYDGSSVQLSSSQVATRNRRLDSNVKTLYHQTNSTAASAIVRSQTFRPGTAGIAGAGMYFAISKADTHHKAHSKGVILSCDVRLGNVKSIPAQGDLTVTFANLQRSGYDSVTIPRPGGTEYVVYHPDQVRSIAIW